MTDSGATNDGPDAGRVVVQSDVPASRENELLALLESQGIEGAGRSPRGEMLVPSEHEAEARRLLADADLSPEEEEIEPEATTVVWSRRGLGGLAAIAIACGLVFWQTHLSAAPVTRRRLLDHGAISWSLVEGGEHWRLLTGVFLHFDGAHLLTNLLTLALVGPPLAHHLGAMRFLLVFLLAGVAGNGASHLLVPTLGLKGGASGAVAGVLGALAGQTLRPEFRGRLRRWQILGALGAVYAMLVGVGPDRDNTAHAAGLLAGLLLGRLITPLPAEQGSAEPRRSG